MHQHLTPPRCAAATTLAALAAALLPTPALAGRAQVGISIGTYATTDLDGATASGQTWRDGQLLQLVTDAAALPDKDFARVNLQVDGLRRSNTARAEAQAQARLRGSGLVFSGNGMVASDLTAGTLALQWRSDLALDPASSPGSPREGFARGFLFAELWETFEVVYPIARLDPVQVTLSLQLTGQIGGTNPAEPLRPGVEAYLALAGVDTGDHHLWLDPVWRTETSVDGTVLSFSGALQSTGCSVARGMCSGFANVYAALDLRGRTAGGAADAWQTVRAPVDLAFDAQLSLQVSDGVTLVRGDVSDALPAVAWAGISPVPEPATLLLWALGAAGLLLRAGGRLSGSGRPARWLGRARHAPA